MDLCCGICISSVVFLYPHSSCILSLLSCLYPVLSYCVMLCHIFLYLVMPHLVLSCRYMSRSSIPLNSSFHHPHLLTDWRTVTSDSPRPRYHRTSLRRHDPYCIHLFPESRHCQSVCGGAHRNVSTLAGTI